MKIISIKKKKKNFIVKIDLELLEEEIIGLKREEEERNKVMLEVDGEDKIYIIKKEKREYLEGLNPNKEKLSNQNKIMEFFKKHQRKIKMFLLPFVVVQALSGTINAADINTPNFNQTEQVYQVEDNNKQVGLGSFVKEDIVLKEEVEYISEKDLIKEMELISEELGIYVNETEMKEYSKKYIEDIQYRENKEGEHYSSREYFDKVFGIKRVFATSKIKMTDTMLENLKDLKIKKVINEANEKVTKEVFTDINSSAMEDLEQIKKDIKFDFVYDYPDSIEKVKNIDVVFEKYDQGVFSAYLEHLPGDKNPTVKIQVSEEIIKLYYTGDENTKKEIKKLYKNSIYHELSHGVYQTSEREAVLFQKEILAEGEVKELLKDGEYRQYTAEQNMNQLFKELIKTDISPDKITKMKKVVSNEDILKQIFNRDTLGIVDGNRNGEGMTNENEYLAVISKEPKPKYLKKKVIEGVEHYDLDIPIGYLFNTIKILEKRGLIQEKEQEVITMVFKNIIMENYGDNISNENELKKVINKTIQQIKGKSKQYTEDIENRFNIDKDINKWFSQVKFKTESPKEVSKLVFNNYDKVKENQQKLNKSKSFSNPSKS